MLNQSHKAKQLVILSGKGGTGKTSISAAMADFAHSERCDFPSVLVDADVDAANLKLVLQAEYSEQHEFWGGSVAEIDSLRCMGCGVCEPVCRYDAVLSEEKYTIDPIACDGCAACMYACPENAIQMVAQKDGLWFQSKTPFGTLFHAELYPGKENSGKLVTLIKQNARLFAEDTQASLLIIDGPPGIGCPVISACAGADLALIVTEPSVAGIHDLQRVYATLQHFKVPVVICINKADIYPEGVAQIHEFSKTHGIEVLNDIPFDDHITQAMVQGRPVTAAFPDAISSKAILQTWQKIITRLF
jgi:MinD superfamily P-loop ATPase